MPRSLKAVLLNAHIEGGHGVQLVVNIWKRREKGLALAFTISLLWMTFGFLDAFVRHSYLYAILDFTMAFAYVYLAKRLHRRSN